MVWRSSAAWLSLYWCQWRQVSRNCPQVKPFGVDVFDGCHEPFGGSSWLRGWLLERQSEAGLKLLPVRSLSFFPSAAWLWSNKGFDRHPEIGSSSLGSPRVFL